MNFLLNNFSFIKPFLNNPGLLERIDLAINNFTILAIIIIILSVIYLLLPDKTKKIFILIIISFFIALPFIIRAFWSYAYDTPFALICFISDLFAFLFLCSIIGNLIFNIFSKKIYSLLSNITIGVVFLTICFLFCSLIRVNIIFNTPLLIIHLLITIFIIFKLIRMLLPYELNHKLIFTWLKLKINFVSLLLILVIILPFLPFLFTPAPPDADITTMSELTGYLLQGKSLEHAESGFKTEWFSFRYPAGLPSLAWGISNLLNVRASEALLLIWVLSYLLLIINIKKLGNYFKLNNFLIVLFSLNLTITYFYGLLGGQVQEMLAYAIGLEMLYLIFKNKLNLSLLCLSAAILLQPIVAIPFLIIMLVNLFKTSLKKEFISQDIFGACILLLTLAYVFILGTGKALSINQPQMMLNDLTLQIFIKNIIHWLNYDTFNLSFFFLFLLVAVIGHKIYAKEQKISYPIGLVVIWFFSANLINGLFGATYLYGFTATFQASFSIIAIWILSVGFTYKILSFYFPRIKNIIFCAFIIIWLIFLAPGFELKPASVFTTHSDVRMCRYLEKIVNKKEIIANITPPSNKWGIDRIQYSWVRGGSARNTLFARAGDHQIKNGYVIQKPFNLVLQSNDINKIIQEFKEKHINYLLILARPETLEFVKPAKLKPIKKINQTYLYKIN
ncbi:MAG: hypothetical protein WC860_01920 [Candidatus Margulisiibacteriota bacterium]|jgi:hypothetical protein